MMLRFGAFPAKPNHFLRFCILGLFLSFSGMTLTSCAGSHAVLGNENGSEPINADEAVEYQNAINRCHKTGGTRIVKVAGNLRCF